MSREEYEVRELVSNFYGGPPIAYILVAGKIVATPCRLNLQPGDRVIIERKLSIENHITDERDPCQNSVSLIFRERPN